MSLQLLVTLQLLVIRANSYLAIWLVVNVLAIRKSLYLELQLLESEQDYFWHYISLALHVTNEINVHRILQLHVTEMNLHIGSTHN